MSGGRQAAEKEGAGEQLERDELALAGKQVEYYHIKGIDRECQKIMWGEIMWRETVWHEAMWREETARSVTWIVA